MWVYEFFCACFMKMVSNINNGVNVLLSGAVHYYNHYRPQGLIFFALGLHFSVTALSLSFFVHPLLACISTAHGPFAWHDRAGMKPLRQKERAATLAFISELHY